MTFLTYTATEFNIMPVSEKKKSSVSKKDKELSPGKSEGEGSPPKPAKKKSFDIKFSTTKKSKMSEATVLNAVLIGKAGTSSKQGILFYLKRQDGDTLPCWADKIMADFVFEGNSVITDDCYVQQKIFHLFNSDGIPLKGNKGYNRRCYLIVVEELPDDEEIRLLMNCIVEEINKFPTLKESQKATVPPNFIVQRGVPFVAMLANEQTVAVCGAVYVPVSELPVFFRANVEKFANFWTEGTMTAKVASWLGAESKWVIPSQLG